VTVAHGGPAADGPATYADAGVDLGAAEEAVARIRRAAATAARPGTRGPIGGFAGLFALDTDRYRRPVLVSSTDGVGTKLLVAKAAARYATIGIDLVAMCVDDVACVGAEPLFLLDYLAVGRVRPDVVETIVAGVARGCALAGCALAGGETAEHPGAMAPDDVDVAGFAVGVVEEGRELGPGRVRAGDALIGLTSPGLRSNGYSLARHVLLDRGRLELGAPAWEGAAHSLADELLRPSVVYAPAVLAAVAAVAGVGVDGAGVHACAHVTGGGLPGNVARILPPTADAAVERGAWETPRIFGEIARLGHVGEDEMTRVFNLGIGMVLAVDPSAVDRAVAALRATLPPESSPVVIGEVRPGSGAVLL
jgi:phosphoribosylformylglycinamidine cyclo-ligase